MIMEIDVTDINDLLKAKRTIEELLYIYYNEKKRDIVMNAIKQMLVDNIGKIESKHNCSIDIDEIMEAISDIEVCGE